MKTTAKCLICGNTHSTANMHKVENRITHYSYMCPTCYEFMLSYFNSEIGDDNPYVRKMVRKGILTEDGKKIGYAVKSGETIGFEFEVGHGVDETKARILQKSGFTRTEDGTVQAEYKSPILTTLNGIPKLLYSVVENGMGSIGNGAGTHVNVWNSSLTSRDFVRIRNRYEMIFRPLFEAVRNDSHHEELFGRKMNRWCNECNANEHCSMVNMEAHKESSPRIEFRICMYHDNKQFMNCLKFCKDCMKTIRVNFCENYWTDSEYGTTKATEHNNHKAEITAQKLVHLYKKYRGL